MGTLCLLQGVAIVAALSGYSLWLLTKSDSPVGRDPQCQSKKPDLQYKIHKLQPRPATYKKNTKVRLKRGKLKISDMDVKAKK